MQALCLSQNALCNNAKNNNKYLFLKKKVKYKNGCVMAFSRASK